MLEVLSIRACTESFTTFKDRLREVLKGREGKRGKEGRDGRMDEWKNEIKTGGL